MTLQEMIDSRRGGTRFVASDKYRATTEHDPPREAMRRTIPPLPAGEGRGEGDTPGHSRITRIFVPLTLTLSLSLREREPQTTRLGFSISPGIGFVGHDGAWPSRR